MNENHVTSFELSKKLSDLGVRIDSIYYWYLNEVSIEGDHWEIGAGKLFIPDGNIEQYPAPLLSELEVRGYA